MKFFFKLLECLWRNKWTKFDGLGAIVITPTRELAFQIFQVLNNIGSYHDFSAALLIGGFFQILGENWEYFRSPELFFGVFLRCFPDSA